MKNLLVLLILQLLFYSCRQENNKTGPILKSSKDVLDLGLIRRNDTLTLSTVIKNEGLDTLIINKIGTSCGCTNAYMTKKNIGPSDSSILFVTYYSDDHADSVLKNVILENNSKEPFKIIMIKGIIR